MTIFDALETGHLLPEGFEVWLAQEVTGRWVTVDPDGTIERVSVVVAAPGDQVVPGNGVVERGTWVFMEPGGNFVVGDAKTRCEAVRYARAFARDEAAGLLKRLCSSMQRVGM